MSKNYDYWRFPEPNFPVTIYWEVIAGNRKLSALEDHDVIFDEYDLKIRKMTLEDIK